MNRNSTEPQLSQSTFYRLELETMAEMTVTPADLENAFIERNIVPKIIKAAPKKLLKVIFLFSFFLTNFKSKLSVANVLHFRRFHIRMVILSNWAMN